MVGLRSPQERGRLGRFVWRCPIIRNIYGPNDGTFYVETISARSCFQVLIPPWARTWCALAHCVESFRIASADFVFYSVATELCWCLPFHASRYPDRLPGLPEAPKHVFRYCRRPPDQREGHGTEYAKSGLRSFSNVCKIIII